MIIRKMTTEDIKGVYHVAKVTWHDTYKGIIPEDIQDKFIEFAYLDNMLKKRLEASVFLVAEQNNQIVGFINISEKKQGAELTALYVCPDHQASGVGGALLEAGLKECGPIDTLSVVVEKENDIGKHFYHRKGFKEIKEFEEEFLGWKLNSVEMTLAVNKKEGTI